MEDDIKDFGGCIWNDKRQMQFKELDSLLFDISTISCTTNAIRGVMKLAERGHDLHLMSADGNIMQFIYDKVFTNVSEKDKVYYSAYMNDLSDVLYKLFCVHKATCDYQTGKHGLDLILEAERLAERLFVNDPVNCKVSLMNFIKENIITCRKAYIKEMSKK